MTITERAAEAELQLVASGCDELLAENTVRQAMNWSIGIAQRVRPELQEKVAMDLFEASLAKPSKYRKSMEEFVASYDFSH